MSAGRLIYDKCATREKTLQSVGPYNYMMYDGKFSSTNKCTMQLGQVAGNMYGTHSRDLIDLESDLLGVTRRATDCSDGKYQPGCKNLDCPQKVNIGPSCSLFDLPPVVQPPAFKPMTCRYYGHPNMQLAVDRSTRPWWQFW